MNFTEPGNIPTLYTFVSVLTFQSMILTKIPTIHHLRVPEVARLQ